MAISFLKTLLVWTACAMVFGNGSGSAAASKPSTTKRSGRQHRNSSLGNIGDAGTALRSKDDLRREIDAAHGEKELAYQDITSIKKDLDALYRDLESIKSRLEAWYRSSDSVWFGGNYRKSIPENSFLGNLGLEQTISERDDLKKQRNRLKNSIATKKAERASIYRNRIEPAKAVIQRNKAMLQKMRNGKDSP